MSLIVIVGLIQVLVCTWSFCNSILGIILYVYSPKYDKNVVDAVHCTITHFTNAELKLQKDCNVHLKETP